jgi:DNA-binding NarL/FixJ family response regulator
MQSEDAEAPWRGQKTSEIATELVLSLKTVQAYCARAKQKRGVASLHELQVAAARQNI